MRYMVSRHVDELSDGGMPASHGAMIHGTASVRVRRNGGGYVLDNAHLDPGSSESHSSILAQDGLPLLKCQSVLRPGCVKQHLLCLQCTV